MLEIGASLREARRRAGLELADVERATMIPARFLGALEEERFEVLPPGLYRRSFLREYADFLGLRGEVYAEEYELRFAPPEPEPPPPPRAGAGLARALGAVSATRAAAVVAVALIGVAAWRLGGASGPRPATPAPAPPAPAPRPRRPVVATTRTPAPPPALTLTAARGTCWLAVQVGSSTGPLVYEQTLQQGQMVRFGLRRPLWIRVGAPWNLEATIGGRSVTAALPQTTGNVVATAGGLRPAP